MLAFGPKGRVQEKAFISVEAGSSYTASLEPGAKPLEGSLQSGRSILTTSWTRLGPTLPTLMVSARRRSPPGSAWTIKPSLTLKDPPMQRAGGRSTVALSQACRHLLKSNLAGMAKSSPRPELGATLCEDRSDSNAKCTQVRYRLQVAGSSKQGLKGPREFGGLQVRACLPLR